MLWGKGWWVAFGGSFVAAGTLIGAAFATHQANGWVGFLLFGSALALPVVWAYALFHWALTTDENARLEPAEASETA